MAGGVQQEALVWAQVVMGASPEGHGSNFLCLSGVKSPVRCRHVPSEWPRRRGWGHGSSGQAVCGTSSPWQFPQK